MSLEKNKKVIAVPRLKKFGEHVNDHQQDIEKRFNEKGFLIGIDDTKFLGEAIEKAKSFRPTKYENNNQSKIANIIKAYIDKI